MHWLSLWWQREVVDGAKGPLLSAFVAFVLTFLTTRTITRLIRAGRGPFRNLSDGGVHLHHSTPGVILLVTGGFCAVGADGNAPLNYLGAVLVGVGASLVLDEFAMIFHLKDVYWSQEGQLSINVVSLAAACIGLAVVGVSPEANVGLGAADVLVRGSVVAALVLHLVLVVITALKGKYPTAVLGIFLSPLVWFGAARIARPTSPWARRFYSPGRREKAARRARTFDRRWGRYRTRWDHLVGGAPTGAPRGTSPTATDGDGENH